MKEPVEVILILFVLAAIIFWKHRANIVRMIRHEEIGLRKK